MSVSGRLIGVDVGVKRIGVARTDPLQLSVNPVATWSPAEVMDRIGEIVKEGPVAAFVVGWPLHSDGREGESTRMVSRFVNQLEKTFPGIPVEQVDERYSSQQAMELLIETGVPRNKRAEKGMLDQAAAVLILHHYMKSSGG
ncbi:MAG: Holliday junction resolvase RuvX [Balneolaceae bacterium]